MKHTEETKKKLSKMRSGANNPFYGKKHTAETKAKMSAAAKKQDRSTGQYKLAEQRVTIPFGETLAYFAGLIDADGSIRFVKSKGHRGGKYPFVAFYNTNEEVIQWVVTVLGHGSIQTGNRGRKTVRVWRLDAARDVYAVVKAIQPWLIVKRQDAQDAIDWLEAKYKWE